MKCKLKKDLPFAKAGDIVTLVNEGRRVEANGYQCDIPTEWSSWFEEVKPEVFWVNKYANGNIFIYSKEDQARQNFKSSRRTDKERTIKVIEVIE